MSLSAEELLKPRFEIIADYPNNYLGRIGDVLDNRQFSRNWNLSDFPHLFKKLNWWEHRKVEDMPKKLICKAIPGDTEIMHIKEWDMNYLMGGLIQKKDKDADYYLLIQNMDIFQ